MGKRKRKQRGQSVRPLRRWCRALRGSTLRGGRTREQRSPRPRRRPGSRTRTRAPSAPFLLAPRCGPWQVVLEVEGLWPDLLGAREKEMTARCLALPCCLSSSSCWGTAGPTLLSSSLWFLGILFASLVTMQSRDGFLGSFFPYSFPVEGRMFADLLSSVTSISFVQGCGNH